MTVDAIFAQALAKSTPAERTAYLDEACADDLTMRQRVETLLQSHEAAGAFLGKPAIQCAVEELAGPAGAEDTQGETPGDDGDAEPLDFLAPSDKPDSLGRLGHYEILEVIGRGGMGVVLRAFDAKLHRVVAIKVMAAQLAANGTARKRFTREARAAAAVGHDHIVTIHAVEEAFLPSPFGGEGLGVRGGLPYLVMQYVSGMSLQQRLDRSGPLELREIVRIGMQTAAGLAAAHAHGLIHRDIKPANILLENGVERVKITDFGLARAVADATLTQSGVVAGTPQYMSPEQARGETVDQRTDLFSLGSVLYAMCAGRPPFRAATGIAVLKRVCEDTPGPIQENHPEVPEWLAEIVTKLHAKDPADRFQSAAEVADLLNRHLAHLQHPSVIGPVAGNLSSPAWRAEPRKGPGAGGEGAVGQAFPRRRRWAPAAALLLLCLIGGLSFTEATGVTTLRATVIRILTPEGTLVVEVDDPEVKVTIEGDGGIVITGAGLQEVRLKPGSYKVQAAKDGKPVRLDQELVTITRGDKQVVKVSRAAIAPAKAAPQEQPQASGEIRRFVGHTNYVWSVAYSPNGRLALSGGADSTLRLWNIGTGEELRRFEGKIAAVTGVAFSSDGQRALSSHVDGNLILWDVESGKEVRRCDRHTDALFCVAISPNDKLAVAGSRGVAILWDLQTGKELRRFKGHKDLVGSVAFSPDGLHILSGGGAEHKTPYPPDADLTVRWWDVKTGAELTTFKGHTNYVQWVAVSPDGRSALSAGSFDGTIRHWDVQTGKQIRLFNQPAGVLGVAFSPNGRYFLCAGGSPFHIDLRDLKTGKQLHRFEGHDELIQSLAFSPDGNTFLSGSWDGTMRLWRLPELVLPEPSAFVVLGGKGVEVRKHDTLAEAVQGAGAGDTIEVRGNGPFVSEPVIIRGNALTIRAGAGFRPVIELSPDGVKAYALLETDVPLVLEGLDLRNMTQGNWRPGVHPCVLYCSGEPLYATNCQFRSRGTASSIDSRSSACDLRNCLLGEAVVWNPSPPGSRLRVGNCLHVGGEIVVGSKTPDARESSTIQLTCNTSVTTHGFLRLHLGDLKGDLRAKHFMVEASGNVFDARNGVLGWFFDKAIPGIEAHALLAKAIGWQGQGNVFAVSGPFVGPSPWSEHAESLDPAKRVKSLADWKRYLGSAEANSVEGRVRYHGGDLSSKLARAPEKLAPEDFRLRPDSAGYRAGKDGKDLGADVDLVGPGPAYERWRKTPEYQQWLKETGQRK